MFLYVPTTNPVKIREKCSIPKIFPKVTLPYVPPLACSSTDPKINFAVVTSNFILSVTDNQIFQIKKMKILGQRTVIYISYISSDLLVFAIFPQRGTCTAIST